MKITQAHVDFYRRRKAPASSLVGKIAPVTPKSWNRPDMGPSIHTLINSQAPRQQQPDRHHDAGNVLAILHSVRKREGAKGVREWLRMMADKPGTVIRPERRAAYSEKWLARIEKG